MFRRCLVVSFVSITCLAGAHYAAARYTGARYAADGAARRPVFSAEMAPEAMDGPDRVLAEELRDRRMRRDAFAQFADQLATELLHGRARLRDATEQLFAFCLQTYPEHLEHLANAMSTSDIKVKLAENLLHTVVATRAEMQRGPSADGVGARLEQELQELALTGSGRSPFAGL